MLLSRSTNILRAVKHLNQAKTTAINVKSVRLRHILAYREIPPPSKSDIITFELLGGLFWWWIFWNLWHSGRHLIEGDAPIPEHWTDEELGIPEDI